MIFLLPTENRRALQYVGGSFYVSTFTSVSVTANERTSNGKTPGLLLPV
jgi:hypothetical protein